MDYPKSDLDDVCIQWTNLEDRPLLGSIPITIDEIKSELAKLGIGTNLKPPHWESILESRNLDLKKELTTGNLSIFPLDQQRALIDGTGIDTPHGRVSKVRWNSESIQTVLTELAKEERDPINYQLFDKLTQINFNFIYGTKSLPHELTKKYYSQPTLACQSSNDEENGTIFNESLPRTRPCHEVQNHHQHDGYSVSTHHSNDILPIHLFQASSKQSPSPELLSTEIPNSTNLATHPLQPDDDLLKRMNDKMFQNDRIGTNRKEISNQNHDQNHLIHYGNPVPSAMKVPNLNPNSVILNPSTSKLDKRGCKPYELISTRLGSKFDGKKDPSDYLNRPGPSTNLSAYPKSLLTQPSQCPYELLGYCRSWNIMHQKCCNYAHTFTCQDTVSKNKPKYTLKKFASGSPEFDYIKIRFINSWIHQGNGHPKISKIYQILCPELEVLFNNRKRVIEQETGGKANITELYHGTCEANFEIIFSKGFLPPADYEPHPNCPVSGPYYGKFSTSLCNRTCQQCSSTPRHSWNICHMWGLGIYCAIESSKSDIYVSNKKGKKTDRSHRKMLICSVILGDSETVECLSKPNQMHKRILPMRGKHSIYAIGMKNQTIPLSSEGHKLAVMNDEYVVFHPHQMLPLYVVEYSK